MNLTSEYLFQCDPSDSSKRKANKQANKQTWFSSADGGQNPTSPMFDFHSSSMSSP